MLTDINIKAQKTCHAEKMKPTQANMTIPSTPSHQSELVSHIDDA